MQRDSVQRVIMLFTGLLLALPVGVAADGAALLPVKQFAEFARAHCTDCHDKDEQKGGFDMEDLLQGSTVEKNPAAWHAVLERIASRDMPPKKRTSRPTEAQYQAMENWLRSQLHAHEAFAALQRPRPMRRLNSEEYNRTIQEVFGIPGMKPAAAFPPELVFAPTTSSKP